MSFNRLPQKDPRTIARDIPGIFDVIFPQLAPGVVTYFNRKGASVDRLKTVPPEIVAGSKLSRAMLFEIAVARAEAIIKGNEAPDWDACCAAALERQRKFYDAQLVTNIEEHDIAVAEWVSNNLVAMLSDIRAQSQPSELLVSPEVQGFQWIAQGNSDFAIGPRIIEVKCSGSRFGSADYRQVLMYWLLSFAASIEQKGSEWANCTLLNPRINFFVEFSFDELLQVVAAGRSKVEILELFSAMIGDYEIKSLPWHRH